MAIVRLWITFDNQSLTPQQTRAAFLDAVRDSVVTAEQQGRVEGVIARELRHAIARQRPEPLELPRLSGKGET